jgi:hypothetical protein
MTGQDEQPDPRGDTRPEGDEPPPILGSWNRLYAVVLGWLALLILLFYIITGIFS